MSTKKVLIVDDVALLAFEVSDIVIDAGFEVVGPATSVAEALTLIDQIGGDVAVVDFHLGDETAEPIAETLQAMGTPIIFLSGSSHEMIPEKFQNVPLLVKPVDSHALLDAIRECLDDQIVHTEATVATPSMSQ